LLTTISCLSVPQANDRQELALGLGYNIVTLGDMQVYVLLNAATAKKLGNHLQPAAYFIDAVGNTTGQLYIFQYIPLSNSGAEVRHLIIDPLEVLYRLAGPLSLGPSLYHLEPQNVDMVNHRVTKYGCKAALTLNSTLQFNLSARQSVTTFPDFTVEETEYLLGLLLSF